MKVTLPKDIIEKIARDRNISEEEAAKVFLDAQDKANEVFNQELGRAYEKTGDDPDGTGIRRFTPREIKEHLDKYVIGQEEYKKRLSIAVAFHFATVMYLQGHPEDRKVKRFRKKNTITAGPTGSGKTYCVEVLGDLLKIPVLTVDATDYTEAGYVGKNADEMIRELIDMAPGTNRREQAEFVSRYGGMIFIDEIDKKAKEGQVIGHDISREGFQRAVLKLIERKLVPIENPYSPSVQIQELMNRNRENKGKNLESMISTENILFLLGGSFERTSNSLNSIVEKRLAHGGNVAEDDTFVIKGFSAEREDPSRRQMHNYYKQADANDFIKFGLLPEIVGRSPIRTFVNPLSKSNLIRIMTDTEDSILTQYKLEFDLFEVDIEFTANAIDFVAERAENMKTGARALVSVWEDILTDFQFELPGSQFEKLVVNRRLCEKPTDVLLEMLERSPFLDYINTFRQEHGIELDITTEAREYVTEYARQTNMQVSQTLKNKMFGATALGFMNIKGPFQITRAMLEDEKYFDTLFTEWYRKDSLKQQVQPGSSENSGA
ncbi:AAA family ATPase [bacterium]|nr:AAA family ATPase [bacterium]